MSTRHLLAVSMRKSMTPDIELENLTKGTLHHFRDARPAPRGERSPAKSMPLDFPPCPAPRAKLSALRLLQTLIYYGWSIISYHVCLKSSPLAPQIKNPE